MEALRQAQQYFLVEGALNPQAREEAERQRMARMDIEARMLVAWDRMITSDMERLRVERRRRDAEILARNAEGRARRAEERAVAAEAHVGVVSISRLARAEVRAEMAEERADAAEAAVRAGRRFYHEI